MDKDPEDVRYNFVRWLNNDIGTAIGPSRINPETGEILDADIILTDGWIRHFRMQFDEGDARGRDAGHGAGNARLACRTAHLGSAGAVRRARRSGHGGRDRSPVRRSPRSPVTPPAA